MTCPYFSLFLSLRNDFMGKRYWRKHKIRNLFRFTINRQPIKSTKKTKQLIHPAFNAILDKKGQGWYISKDQKGTAVKQ